MKNLHYSHCLIGVGIAALLLLVLGVQASTLGVLAAVLICPVMMFVMMKMMMGGDKSADPSEKPAEQRHHG